MNASLTGICHNAYSGILAESNWELHLQNYWLLRHASRFTRFSSASSNCNKYLFTQFSFSILIFSSVPSQSVCTLNNANQLAHKHNWTNGCSENQRLMVKKHIYPHITDEAGYCLRIQSVQKQIIMDIRLYDGWAWFNQTASVSTLWAKPNLVDWHIQNFTIIYCKCRVKA